MFSGFAVFGAHLNILLPKETFASRILELADGAPVISFNILLGDIHGLVPANRSGLRKW